MEGTITLKYNAMEKNALGAPYPIISKETWMFT